MIDVFEKFEVLLFVAFILIVFGLGDYFRKPAICKQCGASQPKFVLSLPKTFRQVFYGGRYCVKCGYEIPLRAFREDGDGTAKGKHLNED